MNVINEYTKTEFIKLFKQFDVKLYMKREDLIHPKISGNKYRKLKYNLEAAIEIKAKTILTFGGAFSNHIAAVAVAGHLKGFKTVGVIRGEELAEKPLNPTLKFAKKHGMIFKFVSRASYRQKEHIDNLKRLKVEFGDFYYIPEGGTNSLAVKGSEEILNASDAGFNTICCSVGTGGTISGLINASNTDQVILGFPALKTTVLQANICKFATAKHWDLIEDYHFGGYAKVNSELIEFINAFKIKHNILLDPIYTGKMMFGIFDLIKKGYFKKGTKILAIHTGGLQGIKGMNTVLKAKGMPLIETF